MDASFSVLVMSVASSAAVALGLTENPQTGTKDTDKDLAKFNIDLLLMLQEKTQGRLSEDEKKLLQAVVTDLQMKFVQTR
jgi:hypothetical protein